MRILYLHQYFVVPERNGGIRSYEMARRLVRSGHHVDLVTTSGMLEGWFEFKSGWNRIDCDGITLHVLKLPYSNKLSFLSRIRVFLAFALRATFYGAKLRPDLVFATSTPLTIGVPGVIISKIARAPFIFEVRDLWPDIPIAMGIIRSRVAIFAARVLEKWIYSNAEHVIALSPGMAEGVSARSTVPVTVIPNAADLEMFDSVVDDPFLIREENPAFASCKLAVYTGTFGRVNNIDYLVGVAVKLMEIGSSLKILLFGSGSEEAKIRRLASARGVLGVNFFMFEPIPKRLLPSLLREATLSISTVLPIRELWNNSANKFFDALAAGLPIAINHHGWQAEIVERARIGVIMDPHSAELGAIALHEFAFNDQALNAARIASRQLGVKEFSRDRLFSKFKDVLESHCEG